jgi:hypothetical protein
MNTPPGESRSGEPLPPLQALDLLRTLAEHGVEFVVIGGFAVAAL